MTKNNQNKFMFYENFLNAIEQLPKEEQANACLEFCRYGITGNLPENRYTAMFCLGVSASVQKYQGRGGLRIGAGRPKKQENQQDNQNQKNQKNQKNQNEQTETKNINIKQKLKTEDITDFESLFTYWEQNKKGGKYKPESRQRMLNKLKELTNNDFDYAKKAIFYAIDNNYQGFTDGSKLYYREKPTQKSLYEKCVENGLKFLEDTDD